MTNMSGEKERDVVTPLAREAPTTYGTSEPTPEDRVGSPVSRPFDAVRACLSRSGFAKTYCLPQLFCSSMISV